MKRLIITSILAAIVAAGTMLKAQGDLDEYLGLPGDNLNLYAVMKLFQESETIEGFERSLNDENSRINNLDLNGDNLIDYIKVIDYVDNDVHTIVLQAILGRKESQDVAVFTVQKFRDGSVQIQLTGDVALYGNNYIIEPIYEETPNPGYLGRTNNPNVTVVRTTYVEVAAWPLVRFIFLPNYVVWRSSYYWGYYPPYWHPWSPYYFHYYYGYHYHWYSHYYGHYHHCNYHRYAHWDNNYYYSKRVYSDNVSRRISSGNYRATYSHPEQRKEGEALYAKAHPERASIMSSGNNNGRRQDSQVTATSQSDETLSSSTRRSAGTVSSNSAGKNNSGQTNGNARRTDINVNEKTAANASSNRNTSNSGRSNGNLNSSSRGNSSTVQNRGNGSDSNSNINNKSRSNSSGGQNNGAVPRSTTTTNNRANSGSSAGKSTVTNNSNRRSSETVSPKPAPKPEKNSGSAKPSGQSQKSGDSSGRSSGEKSKSGSSEKKSNSTKQSDNSNSSRRK